jgi:hypothetical protein
MRTALITSLLLAAALAGVPAHAAAPVPAANVDKSQLAPDAQGLVATDAAFAYVRGRSAEMGKTLSEKKLACYGVSRARLIATLDESMVACYPQIAPENKQRMAIKNAIPAFAMCARKALLHTLNVDPDTVNACIAAAD